jgi:hypothetical protein
MTAKAEPESRFLNASELEMVSLTQYPAIEQLPIEQLKAVGRRLRQAHIRAKGISARQQREIRGKWMHVAPTQCGINSGTMAKSASAPRGPQSRRGRAPSPRRAGHGNGQQGHTLTSCARAEVEQSKQRASGPGSLGI